MNTSDIISKIVETKGFEDFIPKELQDSVAPDGANISVELLIDNEPVKMKIALGVPSKKKTNQNLSVCRLLQRRAGC